MAYVGCKLILAPTTKFSKVWTENSDLPAYSFGVMAGGMFLGWAIFEIVALAIAAPILIGSSAGTLLLGLQWFLIALPVAGLAIGNRYCSYMERKWDKRPDAEQYAHLDKGPVWEVDLVHNRRILLKASMGAIGLSVIAGAVLAVVNPFGQ
jgi:hypothetical protein